MSVYVVLSPLVLGVFKNRQVRDVWLSVMVPAKKLCMCLRALSPVSRSVRVGVTPSSSSSKCGGNGTSWDAEIARVNSSDCLREDTRDWRGSTDKSHVAWPSGSDGIKVSANMPPEGYVSGPYMTRCVVGGYV